MPCFLWLWFPRTSAHEDDDSEEEEEEEREVHPSVVAGFHHLCLLRSDYL